MAWKRFGKGQILIFALLLAGAVALWVGRAEISSLFANSTSAEDTKKKGKKKKRPVPVIVKTVGTAPDNILIEAIGTARAKRFVTLYSESDGVVMDVRVRAGQQVAEGELILELESVDEKLAVEMAATKMEEAKRQLGREQQLRRRRVKSEANVQDAKSAFDRAKVDLARARRALADRQVMAPFAGIVGIPNIEIGDRVTTSTQLVTIDDRSTLLVDFEIAERYMARLREGAKIKASIPAYPDRVFTGVIDRLNSRVDPLSRTIKVRAAFPNAKDQLRPGMSFFVHLNLPGPVHAIVPQLALQWDSGKSFVWKIVKKRAVKVPVRSVRRLGNRILVEGKVAKGDLVVVEGVQRLRKGKKVSYKDPNGRKGGDGKKKKNKDKKSKKEKSGA